MIPCENPHQQQNMCVLSTASAAKKKQKHVHT